MYDKCVLCGMESPYQQNENIEYRIGYIEGAGQLCTTCHLSGKGEKQYLLMEEDLILNNANDTELGMKIRKLYNERISRRY